MEGHDFEYIIADNSKRILSGAHSQVASWSARPKREVSSTANNPNTTRTATCTGFMNNDAGYWTLDYTVPASCWSK